MHQLILYGVCVSVINYIYMGIFSNGFVYSSKNIGIYVTSSIVLMGVVYFLHMPIPLLSVIFNVSNILLMFLFTRNLLISTVFGVFFYSIYHIVWYGIYYSYYQLLENSGKFPFLDIDVKYMYIVLLVVSIIFLLVGYIVYVTINKYDLYMILQQYHLKKESLIFMSIYFLLFIGINVFVYLGWGSKYYMYVSLALLILYVSSIFLIVTIIYFIVRNKITKELLSEQKSIVNRLEEENTVVSEFRHDYKNMLLTIEIFLENNDLDGLTKYYKEYLDYSGNTINRNNSCREMINIEILPLKGLIESKIQAALSQGIDVSIVIPDRIDKVPVPLLDLVRCTGILLDNAIEATIETTRPELRLEIKQVDTECCIKVSNYIGEISVINISKFSEKGFSTKGTERGLGLYNLSKIVNTWRNASFDIYVELDYIYCEICMGI